MKASPLIEFFSEDTEFRPRDEAEIAKWLINIAGRNGKEIENLSLIFCSDEYLLRLNQETLQHDFYTDILTFPYSGAKSKFVSGDIFISIQRVEENAVTFGVAFVDELHRVIIHGLLHLTGFDDHSQAEKEAMKKQEDIALSLRTF